MVRFSPDVSRKRERFELEDGDFVDLDWQLDGEGPIVIVLHGLTGSSESKYILGVQKQLRQLGWRSVALNFRGCSGEPNRLARSYHSGETGDFASILRLVQERFPSSPVGAVGFSLGGNVLLKWLGETQSSDLFGAVASSVPLQLGRCAAQLEQGFARVYMNRFVRDLQQAVIDKYDALLSQGRTESARQLEPYLGLSHIATLRDFDEYVTAPLHGFDGAEHYYAACSSRQFVSSIQTPTTIVHAVDDPFMPDDIHPNEDELSDQVTLELSSRGGHVGFVSGWNPIKPIYWLEQRVVHHLKQLFAESQP